MKGGSKSMKKIIFDFKKYELKQILEAVTCPINRHGTREEHGCDDWELFRHPELLIKHFVENGGAAAFAKRRAEFEREIEIPDPPEYDL